MKKHVIAITAEYLTKQLSENECKYTVEQSWKGRPAWLKLISHPDPLPRFLSVNVPERGELIYKSFGHYYYPIDYTNYEEQRFMDGMAKEYDDMVGNTFNIPMAKTLLERLPLDKIDKNALILDLGCGTGIITNLLLQHGFRNFTLVDFSQGMLDQSRKKLKFINTIRFEHTDLTKQIPEGIFDIVVSVMLFNTFQEKTTEIILKNLLPHLRKNALIGILEDREQKAYKNTLILFSAAWLKLVNGQSISLSERKNKRGYFSLIDTSPETQSPAFRILQSVKELP